MVNQVLSPVYPVCAQTLLVAPEAVATPGTPPAAAAFVTMPVADFSPDPKLQMLRDEAMRGSISNGPYDLLPGPYWTESTVKESPLFGDTIGHVLRNVLGDYTASGTAGTPTYTAPGGITAGAGPITITTGTAAVAGTFIQLGTTGANSENVTVGTGSTATSIIISASTPIRFNHSGSTAITTVTASFTHVFSLLNPASSTGSVSAQPATHSIAHRNQTPGSAGFYADLYPYCCFSSLKLSGAAAGLLTWQGSVTSWPQQAPAGAYAIAPSNVRAIPSWKGTSTVAGSLISNVSEWGMTFTRDLEPIPAVDGQQAPSVIARGGLSATFDLNVMPAIDQSQLNLYLNNTQPTFLWTTSNGLAGASLVSLSVAAQLAGYGSSKLTAGKTVYGYDSSGDLILNTTNAGNSGGYSPAQITLINAVPTF